MDTEGTRLGLNSPLLAADLYSSQANTQEPPSTNGRQILI